MISAWVEAAMLTNRSWNEEAEISVVEGIRFVGGQDVLSRSDASAK